MHMEDQFVLSDILEMWSATSWTAGIRFPTGNQVSDPSKLAFNGHRGLFPQE
jgi:hypothetical protein